MLKYADIFADFADALDDYTIACKDPHSTVLKQHNEKMKVLKKFNAVLTELKKNKQSAP